MTAQSVRAWAEVGCFWSVCAHPSPHSLPRSCPYSLTLNLIQTPTLTLTVTQSHSLCLSLSLSLSLSSGSLSFFLFFCSLSLPLSLSLLALFLSFFFFSLSLSLSLPDTLFILLLLCTLWNTTGFTSCIAGDLDSSGVAVSSEPLPRSLAAASHVLLAWSALRTIRTIKFQAICICICIYIYIYTISYSNPNMLYGIIWTIKHSKGHSVP